ncbi:hypothetical protein, partial [Paenibacillus thermoaerophilus]|uniref:hypothetical protein n=1 Tax=Paenibacillus thermoaerophilus TaxID=1215385 RepID=UPI001B85B3F8
LSISCRMANFSDALYCLLGMKKTPFTAAGFIISPVYLKGSISNFEGTAPILIYALYCLLGMKKTPFTAAGFIISPVYLKGSISNFEGTAPILISVAPMGKTSEQNIQFVNINRWACDLDIVPAIASCDGDAHSAP